MLKAASDTKKGFTAVRGGDGWLFIHNIDNKFEKHTGAITLSDEELQGWKLMLESRDRRTAQIGSRYYFMVAPNKATVYERFLPPEFAGSPLKPMCRLKRYLRENSPFQIVDPTERLVTLAEHKQVYHKTDAHWNDLGAFHAYRELIERIGNHLHVPAIDESQFIFRERTFIGELSARLPEPYPETGQFIKLRKARGNRIFEGTKVKGVGRVQVWENPDRQLPTAVIFHDSFANPMLKFMASSFRRIVNVTSRHLHFDLVESEAPDAVITQVAERNLDPAPGDDACPSLATHCGVSIEQLRGASLDK